MNSTNAKYMRADNTVKKHGKKHGKKHASRNKSERFTADKRNNRNKNKALSWYLPQAVP